MKVKLERCSRDGCTNQYSTYEAITDEIAAKIDAGDLPQAAHAGDDGALICASCWENERPKPEPTPKKTRRSRARR